MHKALKGIYTKRKIILTFLPIVLLVSFLLPLSCAYPSADVVAGSSLIASIVQDIADSKIEVCNLIPPGMCPGHYDIKPSDLEILANSEALFVHNWQQDKANITELLEAANNPDLIVKVIDVQGNWMVPRVQAEAVDEIAQALGKIDSENSVYYSRKAEDRREAILAKGEEIQKEQKEMRLDEVKVICAEIQAGFIKWVGFDVVATYGRPEELSVAGMEKLVADAKQAGVVLVIDNLQSGGTKNSETIAVDIGAVQVTISNFPGGFKETETWEKAIDKNVDLLLEALNN